MNKVWSYLLFYYTEHSFPRACLGVWTDPQARQGVASTLIKDQWQKSALATYKNNERGRLYLNYFISDRSFDAEGLENASTSG